MMKGTSLIKSLANGVKLGFTIIGTTIGAGFASGREIWEFFSSYGEQSINGILIAMLLFALSSMFIIWISYQHKTENYYQVLEILMGKPLAKLFDGFIFLYLFSGSMVMFAGSGAAFEQWNISFLAGVFLLAISVWLVLIRGVNGLMNINSLVIPFLVIILIYVPLQYVSTQRYLSGEFIRAHLEVWPSAVTYSALNVISLLGVLSTMGKKVNGTKEIFLGGAFAAGFLGIIAILLNSSLLRVKYVQQYEIPLFSLVPVGKPMLLFIVMVILWIAIYTTALSNIHALVHRLQKRWNVAAGKISFFIIVIIIPLTFIGFSTLVNFLYPLYGVLNLYVLAVLILYPFQTTK